MSAVQDVYELSPMQQGMLFHTLYAPASGVYVEQRHCLLHGALAVDAFQQAWQQVVARHAVLRTAFHWEEIEKPVQVVYDQADLPWITEDWRELPDNEQTRRLNAFLEQDRACGFYDQFDRPPLMRCALFMLGPYRYRFVWTHHHILMDGWCNALLIQEVLAFYVALRDRQALPSLPPPPLYRDYIVWLQQQDPQQAERYWRAVLGDIDAPTPLGIDRPGQAIVSETPDSRQLELSETLTASLQALARQHRLTLNTVIQGMWAILLSRYSGMADVVFGATVSGRPPTLPGADTMIGLCINTIPVRLQVEPGQSLLPWLQRIQAQQRELEAYAYSALVDIQAWSAVPRGTALFESLLVFENYPMSMLSAAQDDRSGLRMSDGQGFEQTNYPLALMVLPGKSLVLDIRFARGRFASEAIERLLVHVQTLLQAIVADPEQDVASLSLLSQDEWQQVVMSWNQTQTAIPEACVHHLFEQQAKRTPQAPALVSGNRTLSYTGLNRQANQLAHWLRRQGVRPGDRMGVCLERSTNLIITLLAILKAGGNYLPLDPLYPTQRLQFFLHDAKTALLICDHDTLDLANGLDTSLPLVNLSDIAPDLADASSDNPDSPPNPDALAYILYTSGSTGQPKGVPIQHRSLTNLLCAMAKQPGVQPHDTLLAVTTLAFDIAALELFVPLIVGAKLVLADQPSLNDPERLMALLARHEISVMQATPSTWRLLLENGWSGHTGLKILCGGEALDSSLARELLRCGNGLWNLYGPTETTIWSGVLQVGETHLSGSVVPLGPPIANTEFYVLDEGLEPVPIGIAGELYIGGAGLSSGYHQRTELTEAAFIANPLSEVLSEASARLYKTGDRVRWRSDGTLAYLGRMDSQVKLRGFRIELGEIESVLSQHPQVGQAVVSVHQGEILVAYVTSAADDPPKEMLLRQYLGEKLPVYMVPIHYIMLDTLPLTPNGKINRQALPAPEGLPPQGASPRTPAEELVAGIWAQVLGRESVSLSEDFFEAGGHSLLATRVMAQLRQILGVDLPLRTLFDHSRLADFAQAVVQSTPGLSAALVPRERPALLPMSFAQQRLWMLTQIEPDIPWYTLPVALRVLGPLDCDLLAPSLSVIIERHEALRTSFHQDEKGFYVELHPAPACVVPVFDLSQIEPGSRQQWVYELACTAAQHLFDLTQAPLLRAKVLRLAENDHVLLLTLHHIIADAWSLGILVHELARVYDALRQGNTIALPPLPVQYIDYAIWQRDEPTQVHLAEQLAYWQHQLEGVPPLTPLPTDHPRPPVQTGEGATYRFVLPPDLVKAVQRLSHQHGATLFMTLLAAFKVLIYRYSGVTDIVIGTPVSQRQQAEVEGLIGLFINTLVLRTDLSGDLPVSGLLERVRDVALEAYNHQDVPFEQVIEALPLPRSSSHEPLCQVLLVLHNAPLEELELEGLSWAPLTVESQSAKFDLTLILRQSNEGLEGVLEYRTALFEAATIERMSGHLRTVLEGMAEYPQARLSQLPLLSLPEREQLALWNRTETPYPRGSCIHELFEDQVQRTPRATALVMHDERWSYQELNTRANQLARYLRELGVGPEVPVGLWNHRRPETVMAILAILKASGVYVPLDPAYPPERLAFMIDDMHLSIMLTLDPGEPPPALQDAFEHSICLAAVRDELARQSSENLPNLNTPEDLAYILYTSGSTGTPKGVCTPHRGVVRLVQHTSYVELGPEEVILQAAPLTFDASTFEIWGALLNGGELVLLPTSAPSLFELGQLIEQYGITTLWLTAGLFHLMVDEQLERLQGVRQLLAGGDVLSGTHLRNALAELPQLRIINGYGPTEGTTFTCCQVMTHAHPPAGSPPIGTPIANTQVYVLDDAMQAVPVGIPGELYIGGDGLSRGYLNRPELTAAAFVPNPFWHPQAPLSWSTTLYKTGDRVRYLPDGALEFMERIDQQVKIRGFRVELGEIEAALAQHPDVQDAVLTVDGNRSEHKRLVAYLVPQGVADTDGMGGELRRFLAAKLPDYMLPSQFVWLPSLPLTANGKVDRQALPSPHHSPGTAALAPRTEAETQLASIWASLLQVESVGIDENFFELGGDSILAMQIVSRAAQAGLAISPKQIFQHQTVAELAAVAGVASVIPATQGRETGVVPLTPIQQWFFDQHLPQPQHFNQVICLELPSVFDRASLDTALHHVMNHHDAFHLRFQQTETGWQQAFADPGNLDRVTWFDLANLSEPEQTQAITEHAADLQTCLDLAAGPLWRVAGFDLGEQRPAQLLIVIHHLVVDGVSWRTLLEDLQYAYQCCVRDEKVILPLKTASYKQWSNWLRSVADRCAPSLPYWQTALAHATDSIPVDKTDGDHTVRSADRVTLALSPEETEALLHDVPPVYNTQINDALLTAVVHVLALWMGDDKVTVNLENHGRTPDAFATDDLDVSRTIGWFTCLYPVCLHHHTDIGRALKAIKAQLRQVPDQGLSYGLLRYVTGAEGLDAQPAVSFNYLGQFDALQAVSKGFRLASTPVGPTQNEGGERAHLLDIACWVRQGQLHLEWTYSRHRHHHDTIHALAQACVETLQRLIAHCRSAESAGYTPEDFNLVQLDQDTLETVLAQVHFQAEGPA